MEKKLHPEINNETNEFIFLIFQSEKFYSRLK